MRSSSAIARSGLPRRSSQSAPRSRASSQYAPYGYGKAIGERDVSVTCVATVAERVESSRALVQQLLGELGAAELGFDALDVVEHRSVAALLGERGEVATQRKAGDGGAGIPANRGLEIREPPARSPLFRRKSASAKVARGARSLLPPASTRYHFARVLDATGAFVAGRGTVARLAAVACTACAARRAQPAFRRHGELLLGVGVLRGVARLHVGRRQTRRTSQRATGRTATRASRRLTARSTEQGDRLAQALGSAFDVRQRKVEVQSPARSERVRSH